MRHHTAPFLLFLILTVVDFVLIAKLKIFNFYLKTTEIFRSLNKIQLRNMVEWIKWRYFIIRFQNLYQIVNKKRLKKRKLQVYSRYFYQNAVNQNFVWINKAWLFALLWPIYHIGTQTILGIILSHLRSLWNNFVSLTQL